MVHALFVDHAHLMQKPRRFCGARGDDGLYALQRLAASLSKLLFSIRSLGNTGQVVAELKVVTSNKLCEPIL